MSQDLIFQIADALEREGKQPSVALIKSRLPEPRAIPGKTGFSPSAP